MKALLTGASGFLGGHINKALAEKGFDVIPLRYRPESDENFREDIGRIVADARPDVIINAAACQTTKDDPLAIHDLVLSNIALPSYFSWAIREYAPQCVFITFGSSWQYDDVGGMLPFNAYAATKTSAESLLEHYAQDGVRIACLRLFDTYGPNDKRKKVVNLITDAALKREKLNMSGGDQEIDLIHIHDVTTAVFTTIRLLKEKEGCCLRYDVRSGNPVRVRELAEMIVSMQGEKFEEIINLGHYPYRKRERFVQSSHRQTVPGWSPAVSLSQGLRMLIEDRRHRLTDR